MRFRARAWPATSSGCVFHAGAGPSVFDGEPFDEFGLVRVALDSSNAEDALLASGTIPLLASPVRDIAGAPPGNYWDGALVDYHLLLPYHATGTSAAAHRLLSALQRLRDPGLARQAPAVASLAARPPVARRHVARRPVARLPGRRCRTASCPTGRISIATGPTTQAGSAPGKRPSRECGRFAEAVLRLDGAAGPDVDRANLSRSH